jgi:hypothetical protein
MPIYVSTACLPGKAKLSQRLAEYAAERLFHVELGAGVAVKEHELALLPDMVEQRFLIHNYFPPPSDPFVLNLASRDDVVRTRSLDLVINALELSACLGAPFYSVHAGFITDPTGFGTTSFTFPAPDSAEESLWAMERFTKTLETALNHAKQLGLKLLVENNVCPRDLRGKLLLQTANEFLQLFQALPDPDLGLLLDTGHLNVTAHTFAFDPVDFVEQLLSKIQAFHLHENDSLSDSHQPVTAASWVLRILNRTEFIELPLVVESRFQNAAWLFQHITWLYENIHS